MDKVEEQWRVSWEMVTPFQRMDLFSAEAFLGPFSLIHEADWHATERVTDDEEDARHQYATLVQWAVDQTQPIRNVVLEHRKPGLWLRILVGS